MGGGAVRHRLLPDHGSVVPLDEQEQFVEAIDVHARFEQSRH
ncbi:MAG: hypothetical protein AB1625_03390 [Acidobacteriota bacterium]